MAGGRELPGRGGANGGGRSGAEAVAGAADGFEMGGRGAEFAADLHDVLVEGTARGKVVFAPYGVEKGVTGEDFAGMRGKGLQEPEFADAQSLLGAAGGISNTRYSGYSKISIQDFI